jgi:hypothetical protein
MKVIWKKLDLKVQEILKFDKKIHWKFNKITKKDFERKTWFGNQFTLGPTAHATIVDVKCKFNS